MRIETVTTVRYRDEDYDVTKLSIQELQNLRLEMDKERAIIEQQISEAKSKRYHTGEWSDAKWFKSANGAYKAKGFAISVICNELSKRRKERSKSIRSVADYFVDTAKQILSAETFNLIMAKAKELAEREDESS